jgi:hypothetical protein
MAMYMRPPRAPLVHHDRRMPRSAAVAVAVGILLVLALGVWPADALKVADDAAAGLAQSATDFLAGQ